MAKKCSKCKEIEVVDDFYQFLQGKSVPEGYELKHKPKLSAEEAFTIIYVLQEWLNAIPDNIEQCQACTELYETDKEGIYLSDDYKHKSNGRTLARKYWGPYCESCIPLIDFILK